jgi:hypothetical protein
MMGWKCRWVAAAAAAVGDDWHWLCVHIAFICIAELCMGRLRQGIRLFGSSVQFW